MKSKITRRDHLQKYVSKLNKRKVVKTILLHEINTKGYSNMRADRKYNQYNDYIKDVFKGCESSFIHIIIHSDRNNVKCLN